MPRSVTAVYDGSVLRPDVPLDLDRNTRYVITVQPVETNVAGDAWDLLALLAGSVDAPSDWAAEHDRYLTRTPEHNSDGS